MTGCWPRVGVGAVICQDDSLLLVQRAQPPHQGCWAIPGGKVEAGETLLTALQREVMEETGIAVRGGELAWQFEYLEHDQQGHLRFHYVVLDFFAEYLHGDPRPGDDVLAARWIPLAAMDAYPLHPETRKLFATLFPQGHCGASRGGR